MSGASVFTESKNTYESGARYSHAHSAPTHDSFSIQLYSQ